MARALSLFILVMSRSARLEANHVHNVAPNDAKKDQDGQASNASVYDGSSCRVGVR
jgi:hypothetical protein